MTDGAADAAYTLQNLQDMLGVSRADVMGFVREGLVAPSRGARNTYRFGFQDVVLLRTAQTLRASKMSAARVRRALAKLRTLLPAEIPLSGLRISALGDTIAVRDNGQPVAAETGQLLFDFEVAATGGSVLSFTSLASASNAPQPDVSLASTNADPTPDDYLRRGAALVDGGSPDEALAVYEDGIAAHPSAAQLRFNRAVVLEDLDRIDDAVTAYQACLEREPGFADAHWNLARLYEMKGVKTLALRHFSAYRRLSR